MITSLAQNFAAKNPDNSLRTQLFLAQVQCNQGRVSHALGTLQSIAALAHQVGTVATLVAMYDELADKQGAMKVFDAAIDFWSKKVRSRLALPWAVFLKW